MVEMDVCHLLRGRPWHYDLDVEYRERNNTYTFYQDGKKIVLAPYDQKMQNEVVVRRYFLIISMAQDC